MLDTIAARLTAPISAAIATIAIRGPAAEQIIRNKIQLNAPQLQLGKIYYGSWHLDNSLDALSSQAVGEQVVVCLITPDQIEIHCHGGNAVCRAILDELHTAGCTLVSSDQWPSDSSSPCTRAAERDLLLATTDQAAAVLLDQASGALDAELRRIADFLQAGNATEAEASLCSLLSWAEFGLHLACPWSVVLAGPPNVGKSSLMNAMVGTRQAIVHHEPGTTSDWLECRGVIAGWPVAITDTAGMRDTLDTIEDAGIRRGLARLGQADLAVLVVDAMEGWTEVHDSLWAAAPRRKLIAWNKADLATTPAVNSPAACEVVPTSALDQPGVEALLISIACHLVPVPPQEAQAIPFRKEQIDILSASLQALRKASLSEAEDSLRRLFSDL